MSRVQSFVLLAVSFCSALAVLSISESADACSPPPDGWTTGNISFSQPIPTDGVVVFKLFAGGIPADDEHLDITVFDAQDATIAGSLSLVLVEEGNFSEPPGSTSEYLVVWKPDSPLSAQATYTISIEAAHPYDGSSLTVDEELTFTTTSGPVGQLPTTTLSSASLQISEDRAGFACCTHDNFCDSCGQCEQCWATRYAYKPMIEAQLTLPSATAPLTNQIYTEFRSNGELRRVLWNYGNSNQNLFARFAEDATGPFCIEVKTISLIDDTVLGTEERCFTDDDLPTYTERPLTGEGPPAECAADGGQPDAGGSDAGSTDVGTSDTGSQNDTGNQNDTGGDNGGCIQSGPADAPLSPALLALIALAGLSKLRRRRTL